MFRVLTERGIVAQALLSKCLFPPPLEDRAETVDSGRKKEGYLLVLVGRGKWITHAFASPPLVRAGSSISGIGTHPRCIEQNDHKCALNKMDCCARVYNGESMGPRC